MAKIIKVLGCCNKHYCIDAKKGDTLLLQHPSVTNDSVKYVFVDGNLFQNIANTMLQNDGNSYKVENNAVILLKPLTGEARVVIELF